MRLVAHNYGGRSGQNNLFRFLYIEIILLIV